MKRLIGFIVICIIFMIVGVSGTKDITYLSLLILPFQFSGNILRSISENGSFGNFVSITIFLVITLLPIGVLLNKMKKSSVLKFEYILLPILSIALGRTLYLFVNPHILYDSLNPIVIDMMPQASIGDLEVILTSGVAYIFYLLVAIYIVSNVYMNQKFDSIKYFKILIDFIIVIYAFAIFSVGLSALINGFKDLNMVEEQIVLVMKYLAQVLMSGLLVYLLIIFREFIVDLNKDGFQDGLLHTLKKLSDYSFILLVGTLVSQAVINLYQFMVLNKLMNSSFTLDIPIVTILVVSIILIFSRYVTKAIEMKKENELFI